MTWSGPMGLHDQTNVDDPAVAEALAKLNDPDRVGTWIRHGATRDRVSKKANVSSILAALDMLGTEGWELVSAIPGNGLDRGVHWLRRAVTD